MKGTKETAPNTPKRDKIYFMKRALAQAERAFAKDEIPVGAVIVMDGKVIARAHNLRQTKRQATAHAEILAIERACSKIGDWRLDGAELYVTLEPCVMCAGAICNARIDKVYFGAYEPKGGAAVSAFRILENSGLNTSVECEGGLLEGECSALIKRFFENKRKKT